MTLYLADIDNNSIYDESKDLLANRIDFAWEAYIDEKNQKNLREKALLFLIYAFDLTDIKDINGQLITLMAKRKAYKSTNPEFIPGLEPQNLPFKPELVIPEPTPKYGQSTNPIIKQAIANKDLVDVNNDDKSYDMGGSTKFFTSQERAKFRVIIHKGLFYKNNALFDTSKMISHYKYGFASYTLNSNGELSIFNHKGMVDGIGHSSPNSGAPVVSAGEIKIYDGKLIALTPYSGHYKPSLFNVFRVFEYFAHRHVDLSKAELYTYNHPHKFIPNEYISHRTTPGAKFASPVNCLYQYIKRIITSNVDSIQYRILSYKNATIITGLFHVKDKLINSGLTKRRADIANRFETVLAAFKIETKDMIFGKELDEKAQKLAEKIKKFQEENNALSLRFNKNSGNGRLAARMQECLDDLDRLKKTEENTYTTMKATS